MPEPHRPTVRELLPSKFRSLDEVARRQIQDDPELGKTKVGGMLASVVGDKLGDAIRGALDIDAFDLVVGAWSKAKEIEEYADESRHPRGELSTLFLGEHELAYKASPVAEVVVGGMGTIKLRFDLEVAANFRMAELSILDAHIVQIGRSDCLLSAQLTCGGVPLHDRLKSTPVELVNAIVLPKPGLAIG